MHPIGLKLWSTNQNYVEEARRLFEDGIYDYIELYAVPESLDHLEFWKELRIPFIIHAPHYRSGMNLADRSKEKENMDLAMQAIRYADVLNASFIIFHPGVEGGIEETARQLKKIADPRILIENKPYRGRGDIICVGSRPEEINYVMDQCSIGCCLDIGHALCAANSHNIDHAVFLDEFLGLAPSMYHLTGVDPDSELDSHRHLETGRPELEKVIDRLDPTKPVTLETEKNSPHNLNDFAEDAGVFRKISKQWIIRKAVETDCLNVYNLNNSPDVRAQSISTDKIELDSHRNWFSQKLKNRDTLFYIVETWAGRFAGQVRFDLQDSDHWLVSIAVDQTFRARGIGTWAITRTSRMAQVARDLPVVAYVKKQNAGSSRAFLKAGFACAAEETINGGLYCKFELQPFAVKQK